jgi:hypothetical protein
VKRKAWLFSGLLFGIMVYGFQTTPGAKSASSAKTPPQKAVPSKKAAQPQVKAYKVSASLKEVANINRFQGTPEQKKLLAQNLFVVTPTDVEQLFFIYENNDYGNIPSFVTTDLVLQAYHIFFDFTLRKVETDKLSPLLRQLTEGMFRQSMTTWKSVSEPKLKAATLKNVAYFGVAAKSLGLKVDLPPEAASMVQKELTLMDKHEGFRLGAVLPYKIDYSQFIVRGHYTRAETLKRFFKAMMWYGLAPFSFYKQVELSNKPPVRSDETVRMGLLFVRDLYQAKLQDTWERIYEPTAFYVGFADDLTPAEYKGLMDEVFGKDAPVTAFADAAKFDTFIQRGLKLREPLIKPKVIHIVGELLPFPDTKTQQLRFMGQRHIPDSEMFQRLTEPMERFFPAGMDAMAVLGSKRAEWLLDVGYPEPWHFDTQGWKDYKPERDKLVAEFAKVSEKQWTHNLYWGWLWALQPLIRPADESSPSFMRSDAWQDKSLNTALASWAELRHDTILYGKQSLTAVECGGGGEPPVVKGYVEPNVEFYRRLQVLTRLSKEGLARRNLLDLQLKGKFEDFEDMLAFLWRVSEKELRNEKLTREEYEQIRIIGATVERLTLSIIEGKASEWHEISSPTDRNMAVIADAHTGGVAPGLKALEEGVGHVNEMLVIVPIEGKLTLTRGACFSYYEFQHPYEDRLTDEKWQKMLKSSTAPPPPVWTKTFLAPKPTGNRESMSLKVVVYSSGC